SKVNRIAFNEADTNFFLSEGFEMPSNYETNNNSDKIYSQFISYDDKTMENLMKLFNSEEIRSNT
ncbi:14573_t:CDS:1, partial [Racocetra persica]